MHHESFHLAGESLHRSEKVSTQVKIVLARRKHFTARLQTHGFTLVDTDKKNCNDYVKQKTSDMLYGTKEILDSGIIYLSVSDIPVTSLERYNLLISTD